MNFKTKDGTKYAIRSDMAQYFMMTNPQLDLRLDFEILKHVYGLRGCQLITRAEAEARGLFRKGD